MNKTKVKFISNNQHGDGKIGDVGYIEGFVRGADDRPYVVVIVKNNIFMAMSYMLDVITEEEYNHLLTINK